MMDKKLIYRKIRQLQLFRYAYTLSLHSTCTEGHIYEITKLWYDTNKNLKKSIEYSYVKSNGQMPIYDGFDVFDIHVVRLDKKDIHSLICDANSFGIECDKCSPINF